MERILAQINPAVKVIGFEDFTIEIFGQEDLLDGELWSRILNPHNAICRDEIDDADIEEAFEKANTIIAIYKPDRDYFEREHAHPIDGFIFFQHQNNEAYLNLICARQNPRFGPMLLCVMELFLKNIGVDYIYLDASGQNSINFFLRYGYHFSSQPCGEYDPIEESYFYQGRPPNFVAPMGENGVRMKKCQNVPDAVCFRAVEIARNQ